MAGSESDPGGGPARNLAPRTPSSKAD